MNRSDMLATLADVLVALVQTHPVRVGVDGVSAAGKTTLANELAEVIQRRGRPALRICLDNFKRPWSERHQYDRESAEGYYRNAYDYELIRREVLEPLGPLGNGRFRTANIDPVTQVRWSDAVEMASINAIALIDGVFLFRPELNRFWDFRIFVEIDFALVLERGVARDLAWVDSPSDAEELYRTRYIPSEQLYLDKVHPYLYADVIIDNRNVDTPHLRWR